MPLTKPLSKGQFDKLGEWFVFGAAIILVVTGFAKVWSSFGDAKLLEFVDPLLGVKFRYLLAVVGVLELIIAFVCCLPNRNLVSTGLIAWLGTCFAIYRIALWLTEGPAPCPCLGNLTDKLNISPETANAVTITALIYFVTGSYALLIWRWRRRKVECRMPPLSAT
jgi:hypothetical protein